MAASAKAADLPVTASRRRLNPRAMQCSDADPFSPDRYVGGSVMVHERSNSIVRTIPVKTVYRGHEGTRRMVWTGAFADESGRVSGAVKKAKWQNTSTALVLGATATSASSFLNRAPTCDCSR